MAEHHGSLLFLCKRRGTEKQRAAVGKNMRRKCFGDILTQGGKSLLKPLPSEGFFIHHKGNAAEKIPIDEKKFRLCTKLKLIVMPEENLFKLPHKVIKKRHHNTPSSSA